MQDLSTSLFRYNLERLIPSDLDFRKYIASSLNTGSITVSKDTRGSSILVRNGIAYDDKIDTVSRAHQLAESILRLSHVSRIGFFGMGAGHVLNLFKDTDRQLVVFDPDREALYISLSISNFDRLNLKIVASISEFVEESLDLIIVNDGTKNLYPDAYKELEIKSHEAKKSLKTKKISRPKKQINVLVQARGNILSARGGDSIALERTSEALNDLGINVHIDPFAQSNPKDFDLVHLYNFATPDAIEPLARKAVSEGTPYVVTTLYEDRPAFYRQMSVYGIILEQHFNGELNGYTIKDALQIAENSIDSFPDKGELDNHYVAENAACLLASGEAEKQLLLRDYPKTRRIEIAHFGSRGLPDTSSELFGNKYDIKDYILCVARLEWRKNQGMIMKAMEDSEIPVVFVEGNITYQPSYQKIIPYVKRKGRNLLVKNLSVEELSSAYHGALAHVLPSWYELPGLVTLEAARCGTPVVATRLGTLPDYLGDLPFYCEPNNLESIQTAIQEAISTPRDSLRIKNLKPLSETYSWRNTALKIVDTYLSILELRRDQADLRI